jgi:sugar lactone lactonase YvrE
MRIAGQDRCQDNGSNEKLKIGGRLSMEIRVWVDCDNKLGESPIWDEREQLLYWIDGLSCQIWRCAADGSDVQHWDLPATIGSIALREQGGAVVAMETGLHLFDFDTGGLTLVGHPEEGREGVRLNDGKVDGRGRFVVGSLDIDTLYKPPVEGVGRASLYRLDADLRLHVLERNVAMSNGPCWNADNSIFYFADSTRDAIYAYDWDEECGAPRNKRLFHRLKRMETPDGAAVDMDGYLWTTTNGAFTGVGEVRRFAPDGTLDRVIVMPVPSPTSLAFGGADRDILFVTSMNMTSEAPTAPLNGRLFAIHGLGVQGVPIGRFAG